MLTRPIPFVLFVSFCAISPSLAAPRISCPSPVYELGSMDNSRSVERDFEARDEGDATLRIGKVRTLVRGDREDVVEDDRAGYEGDISREALAQGQESEAAQGLLHRQQRSEAAVLQGADDRDGVSPILVAVPTAIIGD